MQAAAQNDSRSAQSEEVISIDEIVFEAGELPVLPQVILKLIDLTNDPKVCPDVVDNVIATDQGTTARVLTLANSSYYGFPRRISSIREAVIILGYKSVNNLATQVTAYNHFLGKSDEASLARRDLWRHSLYAGLCSKIICQWLKPNDSAVVDPHEACTAALLHDMGKMALLAIIPKAYSETRSYAKTAGQRFHQSELNYLPYSHSVIGNAMAERWSLPDVLCDAILNHHSPLDSQTIPQLVAVVTLADELSQGLNGVVNSAVGQDAFSEGVNDAAAILGFNFDVLQGINDACRLEMDKGITLSSFD